MFIQMSVPTWWTVVSEISGRHGASMWGLMNSMGGLCVMVTTFFIGWFVQHRKDLHYSAMDVWNPIFVAMGCLLLVGAALWLFIDPTRSIVERPEAKA
jgi:MFS family permease